MSRLGSGAQATVWLAHDPRLDREVAVKVLRSGADAVSVDSWLHEARAVSRLTHPNIVPVFEADVQSGRTYMVFEYVPGETLTEHMRARSRLRARDAVELMLGVLEGLAAAHAAGVIHRDLKPSNILIDQKGRARVMDFGIAARLSDSGKPQRIVGTPGYISPEAARGEPPAAPMDVFASAIMLAEMLSGERLNYDSDPWRAIRRVLDQDLLVPAGLNADVDDALRTIIQRGLARDARERWPSAQAMHDALGEWLSPTAQAAEVTTDSATLEFLLRRMRHKSDFPAMSDAISRIQRLSDSESQSLPSLSNEILKDVALTHKLLRLVNTPQYGQAGGGTVSTISRAVALIGFAGIRNLALSLVVLERMENKAHAQKLKEEFLRSLMAASLARELCKSQRDDEEAFLCAMFQNLGRVLCEFYFPEEAQQVHRLIRTERNERAGAEGRKAPMSEAAASIQVLGLSFEQLGLGVARQWGLPEVLQRAMVRPEGEAPPRLLENPGDRQRWLSRAANDVADVILHSDPGEAHGRVRAMAQRYSRALGVSVDTFEVAADVARQRLSQLAVAMDIMPSSNSQARRLLVPLTPAPSDSLSEHQLQATVEMTQAQTLPDSRDRIAEMLAAGIQDVTNAMVESFKLNEVLRMILETMYRALNFRRVVFCLRDAKSETLVGRLGLGENVENEAKLIRVPLKLAPGQLPDLFSAVCLKGVDTLIADTGAQKIAERLPSWQAQLNAGSFLILPMQMKGAPFAMIYADKPRAGSIDLDEKELAMLRTLRNQAVMAFRQMS